MSVDSAHASQRQLSVRRASLMFGELRKFSVPQTQQPWTGRHMPERDMWRVTFEPEGVGEVSNVTVPNLWDSDDWLRRIPSVDLHSKWLSLLPTSELADSMTEVIKVIGEASWTIPLPPTSEPADSVTEVIEEASWTIPLPPTSEPADSVTEVIEEASWILLPDSSGDESAVQYQQATMDRARDFLLALMREVRHYSGRSAPVPAINPADAGSIDIFWDLEELQLLVNVSADLDEAITFYGEDKFGTVVSGMRRPSQEAEKVMKRAQLDCLIVWLSVSG